MAETPSELEEELKAMRPRPPSDLLKQRVLEAMAAEEAKPAPSELPGTVLRYAALFALLLGVGALAWTWTPESPSKGGGEVAGAVEEAPADVYHPVRAETEVVGPWEEDIVVLDENRPYRRLRVGLVDHLEWENPRLGRTVKMSKPREHVVLVAMNVD